MERNEAALQRVVGQLRTPLTSRRSVLAGLAGVALQCSGMCSPSAEAADEPAETGAESDDLSAEWDHLPIDALQPENLPETDWRLLYISQNEPIRAARLTVPQDGPAFLGVRLAAMDVAITDELCLSALGVALWVDPLCHARPRDIVFASDGRRRAWLTIATRSTSFLVTITPMGFGLSDDVVTCVNAFVSPRLTEFVSWIYQRESQRPLPDAVMERLNGLYYYPEHEIQNHRVKRRT